MSAPRVLLFVLSALLLAGVLWVSLLPASPGAAPATLAAPPSVTAPAAVPAVVQPAAARMPGTQP